MTRFATVVILACLAVSGPNSVVQATTHRPPAANIDILVNGAPRPRYAHNGRVYVEAVKGEYAIRLRNPYGVRVAIALSVDGLNTIDAQTTTASAARKWVLDPYETVTISGWQTSRTEARRFEFTTEEKSYGKALGRTANFGVISAAFFKERPRPAITNRADERGRAMPARPEPSAADSKAEGEYAATGMGRRTDHAVTQVWLDLEDTPAHTIDIRYEFRPQLVRLGILPEATAADPLVRREGARGFEPGFAPVPPRRP